MTVFEAGLVLTSLPILPSMYGTFGLCFSPEMGSDDGWLDGAQRPARCEMTGSGGRGQAVDRLWRMALFRSSGGGRRA